MHTTQGAHHAGENQGPRRIWFKWLQPGGLWAPVGRNCRPVSCKARGGEGGVLPPRFEQANDGRRVLGMPHTMCIVLCRSWARQWVAWCSLTIGSLSLLDCRAMGASLSTTLSIVRCVFDLATSNAQGSMRTCAPCVSSSTLGYPAAYDATSSPTRGAMGEPKTLASTHLGPR